MDERSDSRLDRRSFVLWAAGTSLGASAFFLLATLFEALTPPSRSIEGMSAVGPLPVARMSDLEIGSPVLARYGDDSVFVIRTGATTARAFNAACPHARCTLAYDAATNRLVCPCHASTFTVEGVRVSGPAPRDLVPAITEVSNGQVIVSGFAS
jgi:cytochrome b6-f complex iron-sulfur subunit